VRFRRSAFSQKCIFAKVRFRENAFSQKCVLQKCIFAKVYFAAALLPRDRRRFARFPPGLGAVDDAAVVPLGVQDADDLRAELQEDRVDVLEARPLEHAERGRQLLPLDVHGAGHLRERGELLARHGAQHVLPARAEHREGGRVRVPAWSFARAPPCEIEPQKRYGVSSLLSAPLACNTFFARRGGPSTTAASARSESGSGGWALNLFSQRVKNLENSARPWGNFRVATYLKFGVRIPSLGYLSLPI